MAKNTLIVLAVSMLASGGFAGDTYRQTPGAGSATTDTSETSMDAHPDRTVDVERRSSTAPMANEKTAMEQDARAKDLALTRSIREKINEDKSLSLRAKNITVISENGKITLKGAISNNAEKSKLEEIAKKATGAKTVENLTEVGTY